MQPQQDLSARPPAKLPELPRGKLGKILLLVAVVVAAAAAITLYFLKFS